jgi:hypothetical protein
VHHVEPNLAVTPEVLDFGDVTKDFSSTQDVELINTGLGPLTVADLTITGDNAEVFQVLNPPAEQVEKDETYTLHVAFTPAQYLPYTATLTIDSDDEESPASVTLTGSGVEAPSPDIECSTESLDFGTVAAGSSSMNYFTCSNVGDGPLEISGVTFGGGGAFEVPTDLTNTTILPGQSQTIVVSYLPSTDAGDYEYMDIASDDPDEPTTRITFVGNGGGADFQYPVAVIDCPSAAAPRDLLTLDGSGSYDPSGNAISQYTWTILDFPDGSDASVQDDTQQFYVQTDIAGTYRVALKVTNAIGIQSAPAICSVDAIPREELHVELTWNTAGADLDLHLLDGTGEFYKDPGDCNWCDKTPDWGVLGAGDDPSLDIDDLYGYGPENINIDSPADDLYHVKVHYFVDNGDGDVTATVRIYTFGALEGEYSKVLTRNKVWDVAEVRMPEGYVVEDTTALYTAPRRGCE